MRTSFNINMTISWTLFGVLACLDVPTLTLWMILGVYTIVIAFVQVGGGNARGRGGSLLYHCCTADLAGIPTSVPSSSSHPCFRTARADGQVPQ